MFNRQTIPILQLAIQNNVINFSTYKGYDGADILKLEFLDFEKLKKVRTLSRSLGFLDNTLKGALHELYVISNLPRDIFSLKEE